MSARAFKCSSAQDRSSRPRNLRVATFYTWMLSNGNINAFLTFGYWVLVAGVSALFLNEIGQLVPIGELSVSSKAICGGGHAKITFLYESQIECSAMLFIGFWELPQQIKLPEQI